ncbi:hypothetical protein NFX46_30030 [Streptomyces phaeoluteigriseus]|uniref:Uncharacterized protein n=1 Tax=Streptomyces phaeoluteigriseus TaxID=114686 RepID=A0ABY4ZGE0_9ACTN|nr:hypothetical protein [Streptomyces phaeoluteigriseus]USQ87590.1 hypothetical protein NFX46_30030 [Streptomyces phaeoluteigriseus]
MTMQRDVHGELRARLHGAAEAYEPNRERILARIERGMVEQERPGGHRSTRPALWGWARIVSATAAVAGMLAVGGYAVASAVKDDPPRQQSVAVPPPPVESPDATSRPPASPKATPGSGGGGQNEAEPSGAPTKSAQAKPSASAPGLLPAVDDTEDGPLWSDGSVDPHSNDFWAQSNVTIKASGQLTKLTVQLKVAQTGGVSSAGAWRSLPEGDFTFTVEERDDFLVYTWVLKEGRTVPEGEWVFAGQYDHDRGGRDAKDDTYAVVGATDGQEGSVGGDFAAQDDDEGDS